MGWSSQARQHAHRAVRGARGPAGDVAVVDDQGVVVVLVGGRRVATVVDPVLKPPTSVGVATHGDAASCDYDDLTLTTSP